MANIINEIVANGVVNVRKEENKMLNLLGKVHQIFMLNCRKQDIANQLLKAFYTNVALLFDQVCPVQMKHLCDCYYLDKYS